MPPPSGKTQRVLQAPLVPKGSHEGLALEDSAAEEIVRPGTGQTYYILVQADIQNARYTLSPDASPTATHGFQLTTTDEPRLISVEAGVTMNFIAEAAGSILQYQWFGIDSQAT